MSRGSICRKTTCDSDCALVNGCRVGGILCEVCGLWYCADEMMDGVCDGCARRGECDEEEEDGDGER